MNAHDHGAAPAPKGMAKPWSGKDCQTERPACPRVLPGGTSAYDRTFGFTTIPGLVVEGVPQEVFLVLPFGRPVPRGTVTLHEAFKADGH